MFDLNTLGAEFGLTTETLVLPKEAYQSKTVEDMSNRILDDIQLTIDALKGYQLGQKTFKSPMAKKIRNGFSIKVGYGSRNERLSKDFVPQKVMVNEKVNELDKATAYLQKAAEKIGDGVADDVLNKKLESFRDRAEKGKKARREKAEARRTKAKA